MLVAADIEVGVVCDSCDVGVEAGRTCPDVYEAALDVLARPCPWKVSDVDLKVLPADESKARGTLCEDCADSEDATEEERRIKGDDVNDEGVRVTSPVEVRDENVTKGEDG